MESEFSAAEFDDLIHSVPGAPDFYDRRARDKWSRVPRRKKARLYLAQWFCSPGYVYIGDPGYEFRAWGWRRSLRPWVKDPIPWATRFPMPGWKEAGSVPYASIHPHLPPHKRRGGTRFSPWEIDMRYTTDPDKVALTDGVRSLTYGELNRQIELISSLAPKGKKVLLRAATTPDNVALLLGLIAGGTTVIPVPARAGDAEVDVLKKVYGAEEVTREEILAGVADHGWEPIWPRDTDLGLIWHSSGTTGMPKGCRITGSVLQAYRRTAYIYGFTADDVYLMPLPLAASATIGTLIPALEAGATIVTMPAWDAKGWLDHVKHSGITVVGAVPAMYFDALRTVGDDTLPNTLRAAFSASANIPGPLRILWSTKSGVPLTDLYAASEHGIIAIDGQILPTAKYSVGEDGEFRVRTPCTMDGYVGGDKPYVYSTGDQVKIVDGLLRVLGRVDDIVNIGGLKCQPAELDALLQRAGISGVTAGVPDERLGSVMAAFVTDDSTLEDIVAACSGVADYKIPRSVVRIEQLPLSPAGKLLRRMLTDAA